MSIPFNTTLVNTGSKLVLLDTGNGPGRGPTVGLVAANLAAAGVDPKTIDTVVISHFHGDHIGGLRTADGQLAFPNAEIKVPAKEWAYWMDDANMNRAPEGSGLANNHRNVRRIFGETRRQGDALRMGQRGRARHHGDRHQWPYARAHIVHRCVGPGQGLIVQADVTAHVALLFVRNPGWNAGVDMDGPQAVATRRKLYDMLATDRILLSGYHMPFPAAGYIEKSSDGGYRVVPVRVEPRPSESTHTSRSRGPPAGGPWQEESKMPRLDVSVGNRRPRRPDVRCGRSGRGDRGRPARTELRPPSSRTIAHRRAGPLPAGPAAPSHLAFSDRAAYPNRRRAPAVVQPIAAAATAARRGFRVVARVVSGAFLDPATRPVAICPAMTIIRSHFAARLRRADGAGARSCDRHPCRRMRLRGTPLNILPAVFLVRSF